MGRFPLHYVAIDVSVPERVISSFDVNDVPMYVFKTQFAALLFVFFASGENTDKLGKTFDGM